MKLQQKDVIITIGPSRAGKGTLLTALKGNTMSLVSVEDLEEDGNTQFQDAAVDEIMVPVNNNDEPLLDENISHQRNSHTLVPRLIYGPYYSQKFEALNGHWLIDFPGMFDSKGGEMQIIIDYALKMIIE